MPGATQAAAHAHKCIGSEEIMHAQVHTYINTDLQLIVIPTHINADTHASQSVKLSQLAS